MSSRPSRWRTLVTDNNKGMTKFQKWRKLTRIFPLKYRDTYLFIARLRHFVVVDPCEPQQFCRKKLFETVQVVKVVQLDLFW